MYLLMYIYIYITDVSDFGCCMISICSEKGWLLPSPVVRPSRSVILRARLAEGQGQGCNATCIAAPETC